jgi:hypothetical protein
MGTRELEPNQWVSIRDVEILAAARKVNRQKISVILRRNLKQEIVMIGKLVATVAFVGMAILAAPVSTHAAVDEVSSQGAGMSVPGTGTA